MDSETLIYEAKPFLCILVAIYALILPNPSQLLMVLSMVLIACGAWILRVRFHARKQKSKVGTMFYEAQPYLYIGIGIYALATQRTSKIAVGCAMLLFICAAVILKWRKDYRG